MGVDAKVPASTCLLVLFALSSFAEAAFVRANCRGIQEFSLSEHQVSCQQSSVLSDDNERLPTCRFLADDVPVELIIFAERVRRRVPLSPVDGRPMERAALGVVEALPGELA